MQPSLTRVLSGLCGAGLLIGSASAASADVPDSQDRAVDVHVSIESEADPGALTLSVADDSVTLLEQDSDAAGNRVFEGSLPTVTVSDTRSEAPEDSYWYVVGNASEFASQDNAISADQLGWAPELVSATDGEVAAEANPATSSKDGGEGLAQSAELLYIADDAVAARELRDSWSATANLTLKTDPDQAAGDYTSMLTLSLWEDTF